MDLQQQQLQQLSDWLKETEGRIRKMEVEPMAGDMPGYLAQIERHRVSELSRCPWYLLRRLIQMLVRRTHVSSAVFTARVVTRYQVTA